MTNDNQRPHRVPVRCRADDFDAGEIVRVPLAKGRGTAVMDAADFDRLSAMGLTDQLFLNGNGERTYVRCWLAKDAGGNVSVARAITGAGPGQVVRYLDGDRTNLRRGNLRVRRGPSCRADRELIQATYAAPVPSGTTSAPQQQPQVSACVR